MLLLSDAVSHSLKLGDLGTWVGSLAVAASLGFLTLSVFQQKRELARQIRLEVSSQARLTSGWIDFVSSQGGEVLVQMTTSNASQLAIRNVRGYLFDQDWNFRAAFFPIPVVPPGPPKESFISSADLPPVMVLVLVFDDDAGLRWRKYARAPLSQLTRGSPDLVDLVDDGN